MFNNSFDVPMGSVANGMVRGESSGGPAGATNSMIPLTKFQDGPDLPPRKDLYMTPQSVLAPPNVYERSDSSYIRMNPVGSVFAPPTQYEGCSSLKKDYSDQLYAEIPGEYLVREDDDNVQYGNVSSSEVKLQLHLAGDVEDGNVSADAKKPDSQS